MHSSPCDGLSPVGDSGIIINIITSYYYYYGYDYYDHVYQGHLNCCTILGPQWLTLAMLSNPLLLYNARGPVAHTGDAL
jgi:hypothetical protein